MTKTSATDTVTPQGGTCVKRRRVSHRLYRTARPGGCPVLTYRLEMLPDRKVRRVSNADADWRCVRPQGQTCQELAPVVTGAMIGRKVKLCRLSHRF